MKKDLTPLAGFELVLDTSTFDVTTSSEVCFVQEVRRLMDLKTVLYEPEVLPDETILYWNYRLDPASKAALPFQRLHLTFGLVFLPPLRVGSEYVKTHGHYHSTIPGSTIGYPEVYTHYFGDLYLFMQRRAFGTTTSLDDCVLYKMKPGQSIMIPPGYAHMLINPSDGPTLMGGLYAQDAFHDYDPVREMRGGAYIFVNGRDLEEPILNSHYTSCPPLRKIEDLSGTRFAPPDRSSPLWSSFVQDPQRYAFITEPEFAKALFKPEDQSR